MTIFLNQEYQLRKSKKKLALLAFSCTYLTAPTAYLQVWDLVAFWVNKSWKLIK